MAAPLFFINGADPDSNAFDWVFETQARRGYGDPIIMDGFDKKNPKPIKGFAGLKLFIDADDAVGHGFLCIMEFMYCGVIDIKTDFSKLVYCFGLTTDLQYSQSDLSALVLSSLLALRRMGLSNNNALPIVERAVLGTLWSLLESFATRSLSVEGR